MFCFNFEKLLNFEGLLTTENIIIKIVILQACISVDRYLTSKGLLVFIATCLKVNRLTDLGLVFFF